MQKARKGDGTYPYPLKFGKFPCFQIFKFALIDLYSAYTAFFANLHRLGQH